MSIYPVRPDDSDVIARYSRGVADVPLCLATHVGPQASYALAQALQDVRREPARDVQAAVARHCKDNVDDVIRRALDAIKRLAIEQEPARDATLWLRGLRPLGPPRRGESGES